MGRDYFLPMTANNPYQDMPDGVIHELPDSRHKLSVIKQGDHLHLVFFEGVSEEIQARINPEEPAYLVSPYTQAMMLAVVLKGDAANVHVVGFGGGRIPMTFRRFNQEMTITCTETDADVVEVAKEFFAAKLDAKLQVHIEDGRRFLERTRSETLYDLIVVDASNGTGVFPAGLSTREFFAVCKRNMVSDGIVVINLHYTDGQYFDKIKTLCASFQSVLILPVDDGYAAILFAANDDFGPTDEIVQKANQIDDAHGRSCPLSDHAARIRTIQQMNGYQTALQSATILTDSSPLALL